VGEATPVSDGADIDGRFPVESRVEVRHIISISRVQSSIAVAEQAAEKISTSEKESLQG